MELCLSSNLLKRHSFSEASSVPFLAKEAHNLFGPPRLTYSQSLDTTGTVNLLRCAPENRSSSRVVSGKWLLKYNYKSQK